MPTAQDFRDYIKRTKLKAADQGLAVLRLSAEDVHICVAGTARGFVDMPSCLDAMKAEIGPNDQVVAPVRGKTNNLTIDYQV